MQASNAIELKTLAAPALILALWQRVRVCAETPQWQPRRRWSRRVRSTMSARELSKRLKLAASLTCERHVCLDVFPPTPVRSRRVKH